MKKKIFLFFGLLFFSFFLAFFIFVNNVFNTKLLKDELNGYFSDEIGKIKDHYNYKEKSPKFVINGKVNLKVFPSAKIIINNVELKDIQYNNYSIGGNLEKIEIRIKFLDILFKNLAIKDLYIANSNLLLEKNVLRDFYLKKVKVKKLVKLEENEILGIKNKLKEILTGKEDNSKNVQEGFKEITVEEDFRVDLENGNLKTFLSRLLFAIKMKSTEHSNFANGEIEFNNFNINLIKNSNIDKEFKNINGKISVKNKNDIKVDFTLLMSSINSRLSFNTGKKGGENHINFTINNDIQDKVEFSYSGKYGVFSAENILNLEGDKKIHVETKSLNNFSQWLFPMSFDLFNRISYSGDILCEIDFIGMLNKPNIKNINVKSKDLLMAGTIDFSNEIKSLNLSVEKMNLNNFVLSTKGKKDRKEIKNITIFNVDNIDKLNDFIQQNSDENKQQIKINVEIKELMSGTSIIKDSKVNFEIIDNFYHIENFNMNIDNINISVKNKEKYKDIYVNDLEVAGDDINKITKIFNGDNYLSFKEFKINSKVVFFKNIAYVIGAKIDNEQQKISGNFELDFISSEKYFAGDLHFDRMKINKKAEKLQVRSLRESLLFLNSIKNNVFLKVKIDNLEYENLFKNTYFESFIHYDSGLLDFYDIKNITNDKVKSLSGNLSLNTNNPKPEINFNFAIGEIKYDANILDYILNVNKYKNIILENDKKLEESSSYWINKLFTVPLWTDINGSGKVEVKNVLLNSKKLEFFDFTSKINNGLIEIENLSFLGLGGNTKIKGAIDMKETRTVNLALSETIYNLGDLLYVITNSKNDALGGTIGIRGTIRAQGFNKSVFLSSMMLNADFIGNNLFIKKIGLQKLQKDLEERNNIRTMDVKKAILDNSGTTLKDFKGSVSINKNLLLLKGEAIDKNYSSNIVLKIDNNNNKPLINFSNISSFLFNIGEKSNQFYYSMSFVEDFNNKAFLNINTEQIEELINILKQNQLKVEGGKRKQKIEIDREKFNVMEIMNNRTDSINKNVSNIYEENILNVPVDGTEINKQEDVENTGETKNSTEEIKNDTAE